MAAMRSSHGSSDRKPSEAREPKTVRMPNRIPTSMAWRRVCFGVQTTCMAWRTVRRPDGWESGMDWEGAGEGGIDMLRRASGLLRRASWCLTFAYLAGWFARRTVSPPQCLPLPGRYALPSWWVCRKTFRFLFFQAHAAPASLLCLERVAARSSVVRPGGGGCYPCSRHP